MLRNYERSLQYFYKFEVAVFRSLGVFGPSSKWSQRKRFIHETCFFLFLVCILEYDFAQFLEVFFQPTILDKLGKVVYVLSSMIASTVKLCWLKTHFKLYRDQVNALHRDVFAPKKPKESVLFSRKLAESNRFHICYSGATFISLIYIMVSKKITYPDELPAPVFIPFEMKTKLQFMAMEFHGFFSIVVMCIMNTAHDMWCASMLIFAHGQMEVLEHRLPNIGEDTKSDLDVRTELKMCIDHHAEVRKFVDSFERLISVPNSVQVFCSLLVLSCNFYAMSFVSLDDDLPTFIKFAIYQLLMLGQIFLICYFPNEITLISNRLSFALYSADWTEWSKENRRLLLLTILPFQNPIVVRPVNHCYCFDLAAFTSVVNASYTYFALLKQMNN